MTDEPTLRLDEGRRLLDAGDLPAAVEHGRHAVDIGTALGNPDIEAMGRRFFGELCVRRANVIASPVKRLGARLQVMAEGVLAQQPALEHEGILGRAAVADFAVKATLALLALLPFWAVVRPTP